MFFLKSWRRHALVWTQLLTRSLWRREGLADSILAQREADRQKDREINNQDDLKFKVERRERRDRYQSRQHQHYSKKRRESPSLSRSPSPKPKKQRIRAADLFEERESSSHRSPISDGEPSHGTYERNRGRQPALRHSLDRHGSFTFYSRSHSHTRNPSQLSRNRHDSCGSYSRSRSRSHNRTHSSPKLLRPYSPSPERQRSAAYGDGMHSPTLPLARRSNSEEEAGCKVRGRYSSPQPPLATAPMRETSPLSEKSMPLTREQEDAVDWDDEPSPRFHKKTVSPSRLSPSMPRQEQKQYKRSDSPLSKPSSCYRSRSRDGIYGNQERDERGRVRQGGRDDRNGDSMRNTRDRYESRRQPSVPRERSISPFSKRKLMTQQLNRWRKKTSFESICNGACGYVTWNWSDWELLHTWP